MANCDFLFAATDKSHRDSRHALIAARRAAEIILARLLVHCYTYRYTIYSQRRAAHLVPCARERVLWCGFILLSKNPTFTV